MAESLAEFAHGEHVGCCRRFEVPRNAGDGVVGETGPVGGIGAIHGDRDAWREHFGGVPETWRYIQDFTGLQSKAGLRGFGEQRKFFEVRALDIGDGGNVIAFLYIEIRGLIRWVGVELFGSVQLANESLGVGAVEMRVGKLAAASTDEESGCTAMETLFENACSGTVQPVGQEIGGSGLDFTEKLREIHVELFTAEVGSRVLLRGVEDEVDEFGHEVILAIDFHREIWKTAGEGLRSPMKGIPIIQRAGDHYRLVAV